jgi:hypothetical protein
MLMLPPMQQAQVLELLRAGNWRTITVGEPGAHGAAVAGTHGVGTPAAAAVSTLHVPNGMMLAMGTWSIMFAVGFISPVTTGTRTASTEGAVPDVHCNCAPIVTSCAMAQSLLESG